jgi:Flp pilus assembly pilin Flp
MVEAALILALVSIVAAGYSVIVTNSLRIQVDDLEKKLPKPSFEQPKYSDN